MKLITIYADNVGPVDIFEHRILREGRRQVAGGLIAERLLAAFGKAEAII